MPHHPRSSHLFSNTQTRWNFQPPKLPHIIAVGRVVELLPQQFQLPQTEEESKPLGAGGTCETSVDWIVQKEPRIHRNILTCWRWGGGFSPKNLGKKTGICVFPLMKLYSSRHHFTWLLSIYLPSQQKWIGDIRHDVNPEENQPPKLSNFKDVSVKSMKIVLFFLYPKKWFSGGKKSEHVVALIPRSTFTNLEQTNWVQKTMEKSGHPTPHGNVLPPEIRAFLKGFPLIRPAIKPFKIWGGVSGGLVD